MPDPRDTPARPTLDTLKRELLLRRLRQQAGERPAGGESPAPIPRAPRDGRLPLSWAQQRLWFIDRMEAEAASGGTSAYHIGTALRLRGRLEPDRLQAAFDALLARHEALRTVFRLQAGEPVQVIQPPGRFALARHDLSGRGGDPEAQVRSELDAEQAQPFDLASGPLIRGRLLHLAPDHHVLALTLHHIVADGWSLGVLVRELSALHAAQGDDPEAAPPLEPLPLQYADYAHWQRSLLDGPALQAQLDHWQAHLAGAPALIDLPLDHPRPPVQRFAGAQHPVRLDPALCRRLAEQARRHGATLHMLLLASFGLLLSRLTGQADLVVGTPVANRPRTELEGLIGLFVNTLALRLQVPGEAPAAQWLAQVRATALAAYTHQDLPFEQVVEALKPARSLSHNPVFQVMFALQNMPSADAMLDGLQAEPLAATRAATACDLSLSLVDRAGPGGDEVAGHFEYASDLFEPATIARWAGHWQHLLRALVEALEQDDARPVDRLPLLDAAAWQQMVHGFQPAPTDWPGPALLHHLVQAQAARRPDAVAVDDGLHRLTYRALDEQANQWAHRLQQAGVGPDRLVALCARQGLARVTACLAVLKAGGAYLPLDPSLPAQRLAYMLADAAPAVLLTEQALLEKLPSTDAEVLTLDSDAPQVARLPRQAPPTPALQPDHLAYVIYTSGSTGQPKGVMLAHRGLCNLVHHTGRTWALGEGHRVLQFANFSFDASTWDIATTLAHGACLVLADDEARLPGQALRAVLQQQRITHAMLPPAALAALPPDAELPTLTHLTVGGEACPAVLVQRWAPGRSFFNAYGPTEATVCVSMDRCDPGASTAPTLGRAIANTRLLVLDPHGQPVPVGVAGEIHVGGPGLARGYLNQPGLTAERFIPLPGVADGRWYRTGDIGRWRADGRLEFLGRNDHQVKIRGLRIELGEIEAALSAQPEVADAVVTVHEAAPGDRRLVAYLQPAPGAPVDTAALRERLATRLAAYMLPAAFVLLQALPRTAIGKLDRAALPRPEAALLATRPFEPPQGPAEEALAAVWQTLLKLPAVGRQDSFFDLGGHSLLIMQLIDQLQQRGWQVGIRDVFSAGSLAALAERLKPAATPVAELPPPAIPAGCRQITPEMLPLVALDDAAIERIVAQVPGGAAQVQDIYPLAPLQEGLLFHRLVDPDTDAYVMSLALSMPSRGDLDRLADALQQVIQRHDALRTAVLWQDLPQPVQVVWRNARLPVLERALDPGQTTASQVRAWMQPRESRLDLRQAPLMRLVVAQEPGSARWVALLQTHHIVSDHVSQDIVLEEVAACLAGQAAALPPAGAYRAYVARARRHDAQAFFASRLSDVDVPTAPFGLLDVQGDGSQAVEARRALPPDLARTLRAQARALGVSAASLFHAAFARVVARTSGRDDVVFGSVLLGRLQGVASEQRTLGLFINTLPLRLALAPLGVADAVRHTHAELSELLAHEQASLAAAQRCSALHAATPLFSALLNYRHSAARPVPQAFEGFHSLGAQERTSYPLVVSVDDLGEGTPGDDTGNGGWMVSAQVQAGVQAERVLDYLIQALQSVSQALAHAPDTPWHRVEVLPPQERAALLAPARQPAAAPMAAAEGLHHRVQAQALAQPDAVALSCQGRHLTYGELNRHANRLAHRLIVQGIGPATLVAVFAERSLEMVVALLATLKAGGAYLPIDTRYPAERIAQVLEDARPPVLLTQAALLHRLPPHEARTMRLDGLLDTPLPADEPPADPLLQDPVVPGLRADHLAYVIYTSGSTGRPKGVMVEHAQVMHLLDASQAHFNFGPEDVWSGFSSVAFDFSVWEIWGALCHGGRLVVVPEDATRSAELFHALLVAERVTVLNQTPSAFLQLVAAQPDGPPQHALRLVIFGGEALSLPSLRPWVARNPLARTRLCNLYGITETTVHVTLQVLSEADVAQEAGSLIGEPLPHLHLLLLDAHGEPVPAGVVGEIHVGGAGLARGYLNQPALTDERFIPHPFAAEGQRLYRSGDLARRREDGRLEYLGRNDQQIKLRGLRVELGEIEAALCRHPGVRQAAVLARRPARGDLRLVAWVVPQGDTPPGPAALHAHLAARLPGYMVPAAFVVVDALPLTVHGKLDARALPEPGDDALHQRAHEAPQGEAEETLAALWAEVLGLQRAGRRDNFFDLGGHSLMVMQVIERLRQSGWQVGVRDFFASADLADLATRLKAAAEDGPGEEGAPGIPEGCTQITPEMLPLVSLGPQEIAAIAATVPGGAANIQDIYPLAPLQEGILFHHLAAPQGDVYVMPVLLSLPSRPQLDDFLAALQAVMDEHDTLRTSVLWAGLPRPVQVVWRRARLPLVALTLDPAADALSQLQARMAPHRLRMDLGQAPLLRAEVAADPHGRGWFLLLLQHHIVNDHVSQQVLLQAVAERLSGAAPARPHHRPRYRGYVAQALAAAASAETQAYFRAQLGDLEQATTPYGLTAPLPAAQAAAPEAPADEACRTLEATLGQALRRLASSSGTSPATLFHTAWALVMARTSGQDDVVFGSVLLGRLQGTAGADRLMGMFINTLPLRLKLAGRSAADAVQMTRQALAELLAHEQAPLSLAQRCSGLPAEQALFQVLFNFRHSGLGGDAAAGAELVRTMGHIEVLATQEHSHYPLVVSVDDHGSSFQLTVQARAGVAAARVLDHLETALRGLVQALRQAPQTPLLHLAVAPEEELGRIAAFETGPSAPQDTQHLLHRLFERTAAQHPSAPALDFDGRVMDYATLDRRANRWARHLRRCGVAPDHLVAIGEEAGIDRVVAVLAVWKAGGAYLPLDPAYPTERLHFMLADAAPTLLLAGPGLAQRLGPLPMPVLALDQLESLSGRLPDTPLPDPDESPSRLAYVIYTSGSTGRPKGTLLAHAGLAGLALHTARAWGCGPGSRVLQFAAFSFDASTWDLATTLCSGACLVLAPADALRAGPPLLQTLQRQRITHAMLPPAAVAALPPGAELPLLQTLTVGGEACPPHLVQRWAPGRRMLNAYGPTEATVCVSLHTCTADETGPPPIGRPVANTLLRVLDTHGQRTPIGVPGELHIGGPGLARGYLGLPALTAERFVPDPVDGEAGPRLYRSGDLARWREDGELEFLGRMDRQLKLRGFRIEPGEIEAALAEQPCVAQAAVLLREDLPGDARLVAYVTRAEASQAQEDAHDFVARCREALRARLPAHQVPAAILLLQALPTTPAGKLDRAALPAPLEDDAAAAPYQPPRGPVEEALAQAWQEVLAVPRVGRLDHFFDLGGHSLLAVQVAARLTSRWDGATLLRALFERPVLADLAAGLPRAGTEGDPPAEGPGAGPGATGDDALPRADRSGPLPLSWAQQRMWFVEQLATGGEASHPALAHHIPLALALRGELSVPALQAALDALAARHESLRTVFRQQEGEPVQVVLPAAPFALRCLDLAQASDPQQAAHAQIAEEAAAPFDLAEGPLARGRLLRLGAGHHVLALTLHHIVSDGWSMGVLVRELSALYAAFQAGRPDPLPALPLQYADHAVWQRRHLSGPVLQAQLAHWRERLAGAPGLLALPTDRRRPVRQNFDGASLPLQLEPALGRRLLLQARRQGVTLHMLLCSGLAVLLSRLSGQDDLVIGTPVAHRQRPEVEGLIGFFVNTLALRFELGADPTVRQLLQQARHTALDAYAHQDLPFEQVVEALKPERLLGHHPVFQVMLALQNTPASTLALPGLQLSPLELPQVGASFDLTLSLQQQGDTIAGSVIYATALFDASTVARWMRQWQHLLQALLDELERDEGPALPVSALLMLDADERAQVLQHFQPQDRPRIEGALVHRLFEARAAAQPEALAMEFPGGRMSYRELNQQANQLAHGLRQHGVGPDQTVALWLERSPRMVVAMLAVLKAGGAYLPVDVASPPGRMAALLQDAGPRLLLAQPGLGGELPEGPWPRVATEAGWQALVQGQPLHDLADTGVREQHLACVIYTSGSTGRPKGVMVEHHNIVALVASNHFAPLTPDDGTVHCANPAFDASTWEVWGALLAGASLLVVPQAVLLDPQAFSACLAGSRANTLFLTTALFNQYSALAAPALARMDVLMFGGERADLQAVRRMLSLKETQGRSQGSLTPSGGQARSGGPAGTEKVAQRLVHCYGPTETTTFATTFDVLSVAADDVSLPIGRGIGGARIYLLDTHLQPVPVGVVGEICIGGAGVTRGYLSQPELTRERFVQTPWGRLYRTGDLGRWTPAGEIDFIGRKDQQVKLRGFRVELGDIEAALRRYEGVQQAAVVMQPAAAEPDSPQRLVAFVCPPPGQPAPSATALREHLALQLPPYMLPAAYVVLDTLPLTANGKLDLRRLPPPRPDPADTAPGEPPQGAFEQGLAQIWQELLGGPQVHRHDNFFALGGHSLLAVQLAARVRERLGRVLVLRDLFEHPELQALAAHLSASGPQDLLPDAGSTPIPRADRSRPLALSWGQQRLWFIDQLERGSGAAQAAYNVPVALRLRGRLDRAALQASLDRLVARHESLRTTFAATEGQPVQVIHPPAPFALREEDLTALDALQAADAVQQHLREEAATGFDLQAGPLARGRLLRLPGGEQVLALTLHHIITDGWSMGVLVRELTALYGASQAAGAAAATRTWTDPWPPLPIQYADHAQWQRSQLTGEHLARQQAYWRRQLAGAPALLQLPGDRPRPARQSFAGASHSFTLAPDLSRRLAEQARHHGVTLHMLLLAGWATLLWRLSGQTDLVIGTPVANRPQQELEGLIGFFVNSLALRVQPAPGMAVAGLLAQVKETTLEAYAHQDLPFEQVVEVVAPPRSLAHSPVFQVVFALQNMPLGGTALPGLEVSSEPVVMGNAQFDLTLSMVERGEDIAGSLDYVQDLFDAATIGRWVASLQTLLQGLVEALAQAPDTPLARLPLLSGEARTRLLDAVLPRWSAPAPGGCIHHHVEAQALARPEAPALVFGGQAWSYAELNQRANRLARELQALGVGPETPVAVCAERSPQMVLGWLATLKAGGAYLPLDPAYPLERKAWMLDDAAPGALLATRRTQDDLPASYLPLVLLDDEAAWARHSPEDLGAQAAGTADSLAYLIYTSGSTGTPKGVLVEHRNVVALALGSSTAGDAGSAGYAPVGPQDCIVHCANPVFDASTWEVWAGLMTGARVLIIPQAVLLQPAAFAGTLQAAGATALFLTTALFNACGPALTPALPGLKHLLFGGEQADLHAVRRLLQGPRPQRLVHCYGPTETTTFATTHVVRSLPEDAQHLPIGKPVPHGLALVLDETGQPVPIGVAGEIHLGGAGVARGYLNQPALTQARFVDTEWGRLYRTGDLGCWNAAGELVFLGRLDQQVKIRGQRIEPGETEAALLGQAGVARAVVMAREDSPGDRRLVAYVVMQGPSEAAATDVALRLRDALKAALPAYQVPSAVVVLPDLPLNANGKVDRSALPAPDRDDLATAAYEPPQGALETQLAQAWQAVLHLPQVGRRDHFFDLGGNSLLAVELASRLQAQGLDLPLVALFQRPVLAELAAGLQPGAAGDPPAEAANPVLLRAGASPGDPVLYLVPEGSGQTWPYLALAREMPPGLALCALQAPGWLDDNSGLQSVRALAAHHVAAIRAHQPQGPYRLAGWSFGGVLAWEIAQQLLGQDQEVDFVGLIDAYAPRVATRALGELGERATAVRYLTAELEIEDPGVVQALEQAGSVDAVIATAQAHGLLPEDVDLQGVHRALQRHAQTQHLQDDYHAAPLPCPVHLLAAAHRVGDDEHRGWTRVMGRPPLLQVIGGNHQTLMKPPHLAALCRALHTAVRDAAARAVAAPTAAPTAPSPLTMIQTGRADSGPPIVCLPGAGAAVTHFIPLAQALGAGVSVFGMQPRGLDGRAVPHTSVEAAAAAYLQALRRQQPQGPYRLVGHSFGGWVAFEMALQLQAAGQQVARLVVIDSSVPDDHRSKARYYSRGQMFSYLVRLLEQGSGKPLGVSLQHLAGLETAAQVEHLLERMKAAGVVPAATRVAAIEGLVRVFETNLNTPYVPRGRFDGRLTLFNAAEAAPDAEPEDANAYRVAGWRAHAAELQDFELAGNHMTLLNAPSVQAMADFLLRSGPASGVREGGR